jgi:hypothetical protein
MSLIRRDPVANALRSDRRKAWVDVQRNRNNDGDEANARWYKADDALKARRASRRQNRRSRS